MIWNSPKNIQFQSIHQDKSQYLVEQSQLDHLQPLGNSKSSTKDRSDDTISQLTNLTVVFMSIFISSTYFILGSCRII